MLQCLRDRIAAVLKEHQDESDAGPDCTCGWEWQGYGLWKDCYAGHVADAILAIPGIAVVELPEPDEGLGQPNYVAMPGTVFVELGPGEPIPLSPGVARVFAAALLAAADRAERDQ